MKYTLLKLVSLGILFSTSHIFPADPTAQVEEAASHYGDEIDNYYLPSDEELPSEEDYDADDEIGDYFLPSDEDEYASEE